MKREYTTPTRKKCFNCGSKLELNSCWPQNSPLITNLGWAYWYCSDTSCREHTRPKDKDDLLLGADFRSPHSSDTFIEWDSVV